MFQKLIMSCTALVLLAVFALPAVAAAANDPQLTSGGVLVPKGTSITFTAVNVVFTDTNGNGLFTCSHAHLTGTLTKNEASTVEGEIPVGSALVKGTGATSPHNGLPECTGSFGNAFITVPGKLCIKSSPAEANDEVLITGCGSKVKFILGSTTAGECEWETTGSVQADATTGGTGATVTTRDTSAGSGLTNIRGGFLCPTTLALKMTFDLTTPNGTPLTIS